MHQHFDYFMAYALLKLHNAVRTCFQDLKLSKVRKENVVHSHAEPQRAGNDRSGRRHCSVLATITSEADGKDFVCQALRHHALYSLAAAVVVVAVMHLIGRAQDLSPTILP